MVSPAASTLTDIKTKVRRLTASPDETQLADTDLEVYINTFVDQDFPASIKVDYQKEIYEIWTEPNIETYTLLTNIYQGFSGPVYVQGYQIPLFKSRGEFYKYHKNAATSSTPASGDGSAGPYSFTISDTPFLRDRVTLNAKDGSGNSMIIEDDGAGLLFQTSGGASVGIVNYVTGAVSVTFPNAVPSGNDIRAQVVQYTTGRPTSALIFRNQLYLRNVPDDVYRVSLEAYATPSQLLAEGSAPELNQWWQYIAFGAAMKVFEDRGDMEGLNDIYPLFKRQQNMVLKRTATEYANQRPATIFTGGPAEYYGGPDW